MTTASDAMSTKISKTPVLTMKDNDVTPDNHNAENNGVSNTGHSESGDLQSAIQGLLSRVADIPIDTITLDSTLEDLGIDSLMVTEVLSEVRQAFSVDIPPGDFQDLQDIKSLCNYLRPKVSGFRGSSFVSDLDGSDSLSSASNSTILTAASSFIDVESQDGLVSQLAKLVGQHLETSMEMTPTTSLADAGLDSLLSIELLSDIDKIFGAKVELAAETTFGDLCEMVLGQQVTLPSAAVAQEKSELFPSSATIPDISIQLVKTPPSSAITAHSDVSSATSLVHVQRAFEHIRYDYDRFAKETGFCNFWTQVYPAQARLVVAYVVEAFKSLGCSLATLRPGNKLPPVQVLPKHNLLMTQLYEVLKDASLISLDKTSFVRTNKPVDNKSANELFHRIILDFPQHATEHKLLHITGSRLADCLSGTADPLQLLFRRQADKELLEDVYTNGPMYMAVSRHLGSFFTQAFTTHDSKSPFHILELGGGTGGTTKYIVDHLVRQKIPFTYTFTDISPSLVAAAKKKFAGRDYMQFKVIDIEKSPPEGFTDRYHAVISTNCIHATRNLALSSKNIRKMLRRDGFVSLVEFTRNMFWFDLVFGLLEGWWLFEDGRGHVLADETFWEKSLKAGGFKHVAWTEGDTAEANTLRIIVGFQDEPEALARKVQNTPRKPQQAMETVIFKQVGELSLLADIYYPAGSEVSERKRPVGMEILIPEKALEL
jgi:acyl carrier protein/SAM-dependent methyltransferase